jgi:hypothetical protein
MKPKVGQSFWSALVDEGKIFFREWIITSIQRRCVFKPIPGYPDSGSYERRAYLTCKNKYTWVKKSKKHFDYGWAKSISKSDKTVLHLLDDGSLRPSKFKWLFTTKLQALKREEKDLVRYLAGDFEDDEEDGEVITVQEQIRLLKKDLAAVRRAMTRERKAKGLKNV